MKYKPQGLRKATAREFHKEKRRVDEANLQPEREKRRKNMQMIQTSEHLQTYECKTKLAIYL